MTLSLFPLIRFALVTLPFILGVQLSAADVETMLLDPIDTARNRTVPIKVYRVPADEPQPVVLFSHGLGGSRDNNPYLGNHWAEKGYVVVFVQHAGSDEDVWASVAPRERMEALRAAAGLQALVDRLADIPFVLDQLESFHKDPNHPLHGALDLEHIGLAGHSFGAVTTLGLAGRMYPAGKTFYDDRIDAFLPMSPQPGKGFSTERAFGNIKVPMLCMTGTEDGSPIDATVTPESRREVYEALPEGDKYQLVFEGGQHFAFGQSEDGFKAQMRDPDHHPVILALSTRFWDAYLKDDAAAKEWLQSEQPREDTPMDAKDVWEWK